ncbi:helix-turn-helix domain-containing protein [Roseibium sp. Sym1]|uniref:helix-turn-helix domain-containing protein n=1 Tax=Roseibium sp. Sym1 TaxID=3016006 RepID=UPI003FA76313
MRSVGFHSWRVRHKLSLAQASQVLGCSKTSLVNWEKGRTRIPLYIALACSAYSFGLPPMD